MNYILQYRKLGALAALLLIVALVIAFRSGFWTRPDASPILVNDSAVQTDIKKPTGIIRAGIVENPYVVPINSGFLGRVTDVYVTAGQAVKAGEPLFKVEAASGSDEASIKTANQKTGVPLTGRDNYENALNEYNRFKKLYEQGAIPRRQLENAAARLQAAQANPNGGSATITGPVVITATVEGFVTDLAAAAGDVVQVGQQVMALGSGQTVEIVVPLDQKELYLVHLGTPVAIEVEGHTITGQVSSIFPEVQQNNISCFLAHIKVNKPPEGLLKAGMAVNVRIYTE